MRRLTAVLASAFLLSLGNITSGVEPYTTNQPVAARAPSKEGKKKSPDKVQAIPCENSASNTPDMEARNYLKRIEGVIRSLSSSNQTLKTNPINLTPLCAAPGYAGEYLAICRQDIRWSKSVLELRYKIQDCLEKQAISESLEITMSDGKVIKQQQRQCKIKIFVQCNVTLPGMH